jgi:hypothetical protein
MSGEGKHRFVSWVRRGIGASVNATPAAGQSRVTVDVQLTIADREGTAYPAQPKVVQVQLYGHGDVTGIDPRLVNRTDPLQGTKNFEPNYLCSVEFHGPDLPWMFSPSGPTGTNSTTVSDNLPSGERLTPWMVLIVLKPTEFTHPSLSANSTALDPSRIQVLNIAALQDLSDAWNWAHVQISADRNLADALAQSDGSVISRLICPRRLDPESDYFGFLVPAYEIGRLKGLGKDTSGVNPTTPAWTHQTAVPLDLPLYALSGGDGVPRYKLDFHTSDEGDFETLVRRLKPIKNLSGVGQRPMDVSLPGLGLPLAATKPLGLEGALASPGTTSTPWPSSEQTAFQTNLQNRINQTSPVTDDPGDPRPEDPVVAPPIYGRWPAGVSTVASGSHAWVSNLNLDPRTRAAAGLGTQVVQKQRTQLLASAWQQVEGILEANQKIQQAQLAQAALKQVYWNKYEKAAPETVLNLTSPLLSRLRTGARTVRAVVRESHVPEQVLSATYRRVTRPKRLLISHLARREALLRKVNNGSVVIAPQARAPGGLVSLEQVSDLRSIPAQTQLLAIQDAVQAARANTHGGARRFFLTVVSLIVRAGMPLAKAWDKLAQTLTGRGISNQLRMSHFTTAEIAAVPQRQNFTLSAPNVSPVPPATASNGDSDEAKAFRAASSELFAAFQDHPVDPLAKPPLQLDSLQTNILNRLDPELTVSRRIRGIVSLERIKWEPTDILASPILAAPEFPQPMYLALRDLSPTYLLPGADQIPADSISLVSQNHKFIESFMVGLSHELTRQLIWEGYPTFDQRGTYFRQFWDVSAYVPQRGDPTDPDALSELLKDIPIVSLWDQALGENLNRRDVAPNNVVLLIRGELFRRYPNAVVYAVKAKPDGKGKRVRDDTDQRYPMFRGSLPSDTTFLGFNLSIEDARGGTAASPDGFFFVFQQPPAEPRFGLEPIRTQAPTARWAELAWANFTRGPTVVARRAVSATTNVRKLAGSSHWRFSSQVFSMVQRDFQLPAFLSASLMPSNMGALADPVDQSNSWGQNSAQTAYILLRMPFRILIHADLLLPS